MGLLERAGLAAAFVLTVTGVGLVFLPAGLVVAGVLVGVAFWPDRTAPVSK